MAAWLLWSCQFAKLSSTLALFVVPAYAASTTDTVLCRFVSSQPVVLVTETPPCSSGPAGLSSLVPSHLAESSPLLPAAARRRDRLAVVTQLLVPLLLVLIAMSVSNLETSTPQQPPLAMTRERCLMGKPALLAAAPAVRQQVEFRGFMDGYPR